MVKFVDEGIWKRHPNSTSDGVDLPKTLLGIDINPEVLTLPQVCEKRMNSYIHIKFVDEDYDATDK